MRSDLRLLSAAFTALIPLALLSQNLSPRAYLITPVHPNAVNLTYSFQDEDIVLRNGMRYGGNFQNIAIGWQYSWVGRPN